MGTGELAALTAAFMWTVASMFWGRINLSAMSLNLSKNLIGVVLILVHVLVVAWWFQQSPFQASATSWGWLAVSGLIGIVIGDGFYFRCLQILGPRLALMLATTSPFFSALLGWWLLGESLTYAAVSGIALTTGGVIVVVSDRKAKKESPGLMPGTVSTGVLAGIVGAFCQAVGGVLARTGMVGPEGEMLCHPIEATFIRILVAAIGTCLFVLLQRRFRKTIKTILEKAHLKLVIPATAIGTWLGIWLSQIAFQQTDAAIAQTLMATCPLFAIPIVWMTHKHRITLMSLIGSVIAVYGIYLIATN